MKSLLQSNLSWLILFYLFTIFLTYAMDENKTKVYSVQQLQHDFSKLMKNPEKYVEFYLNADNTDDLNAKKTYDFNAGGLYKLLPYYQKINILGEKENYAIKWCQFQKEYQLIKVNPLGDVPFSSALFDTAEPIATLLKGEQFSRPTHADIKAYKTYEQMKSMVNTVGRKNEELKLKIIEMEKEIDFVQTKANDEITSVREENKQLKEILTKCKEQNKKLKTHAHDQSNISKKAIEENTIQAEENKIQTDENQKILAELENLKLNLKDYENQIEKKNQENRNLENQKGDLSYKLDFLKECEQKFLSSEKEALKAQKIFKDELKNKFNELNEIKVKLALKENNVSDEKSKPLITAKDNEFVICGKKFDANYVNEMFKEICTVTKNNDSFSKYVGEFSGSILNSKNSLNTTK